MKTIILLLGLILLSSIAIAAPPKHAPLPPERPKAEPPPKPSTFCDTPERMSVIFISSGFELLMQYKTSQGQDMIIAFNPKVGTIVHLMKHEAELCVMSTGKIQAVDKEGLNSLVLQVVKERA